MAFINTLTLGHPVRDKELVSPDRIMTGIVFQLVARHSLNVCNIYRSACDKL